jgi:hypothetical protein
MHITVEEARLTVEGPHRWWNLYTRVDREDGSEPYMMSHKFPEETFEWRVAEYDLDPTDRDTLLHIVLYEPYLNEDDRDPDQSHVHAPSVAAARDYHLGRIRELGGKRPLRGSRGMAADTVPLPDPVAVHSAEEDPIEVLRREMVLSHPHIAVKREAVAHHRRAVRAKRAERRTASPEWARPTPDQDRARLLPRKGSTTQRSSRSQDG